MAVLELSVSQTCNSMEIKWACLYNEKDCCDNCSDRTVSVKQGVTSQTCDSMELKWACLYEEKDCYDNCSDRTVKQGVTISCPAKNTSVDFHPTNSCSEKPG